MNRVSSYLNSVLRYSLIGYMARYALWQANSKLTRTSSAAAHLVATIQACSTKRHAWQLQSARPALVRVKLIT